MKKEQILIVDDEEDMRDFLEIMLKKEGYDVSAFGSAKGAVEVFSEKDFDIVITDMRMPDMNGLELLKALKALRSDVIVIMVTAYASVDTAIEAMKAGAYDYFTKPFNIEEIKVNIRKALKVRNLERENKLLKDDLKSRFGFQNLIGTDPKMVEVYELIKGVARTRSNVLVTGESGTGKELVARAIHYESERKDNPFVAINCGAIPETLLESELFGHEKGAFTGAVSSKAGLVGAADGGTLFLDEITEMALQLQVKLLRFIQERSFRRVGSSTDMKTDIRIIAASNKVLEDAVGEGKFREDLYYRLNVIAIQIPPLRERSGDIPLLVKHFVGKYNDDHNKSITGVSEDAMEILLNYAYHGNVRELENIIEYSVALEDGDTIFPESLPKDIRDRTGRGRGGGRIPKGGSMQLDEIFASVDSLKVPSDGIKDLEGNMEALERAIIVDALKRSGGVKKKAADLLGLSFRSIRYKISKYGISDE